MSNKISNEQSALFNTRSGRKTLIDLYGNESNLYMGVDEEQNNIVISIAKDGIELTTLQKNGWVQKLYYDENGNLEGESFDGKWK